MTKLWNIGRKLENFFPKTLYLFIFLYKITMRDNEYFIENNQL